MYKVKIIFEGETRQDRIDKIVEEVSKKFQRELEKIIKREGDCDHVWKHGGDVFYFCEKCGIGKRSYHKNQNDD